MRCPPFSHGEQDSWQVMSKLPRNNLHGVKNMPTLRWMTNDDLLAYKHLCSICYIYPDTNEPEKLSDETLHAYRGVFDDDGRLISAMMQQPYEVRFADGSPEGGKTVKLAGIGGVVTDPTARAGGNVRRIFEEDLPRLYHEGYVFSALYPFSYRFYGKFGYTWAKFWHNEEISRSDLRSDLCRADEIIRVLPEEDDRDMRIVYESYIADKNLAVCRNDRMWSDLRKGTPWESLKHAYVLRSRGQPIAYWIGQMERKSHGKVLRMLDMAWTCYQGQEAIFAMIRSMNEVDTIAMRVQSDFEPRMLMDEAYNVTDCGSGTAMVRVLNVERALALMTPPLLPGTMTIEVQDEQIRENCGKYMVTSDGYSLTVEKTDVLPADLCCDIRGLTALVIGRQHFANALAAGIATLKNPKKMRYAALLFSERKLHMNLNF